MSAMAHNIFLSLLGWIIIHCNASLSSLQTQKSVTFNPSEVSSINSADEYISVDSQVSNTANHWQIKKQSEPQSAYDIKVSLSDIWGFKSDAISTISITVNGEPLIDIGNDMTLYLVFAVDDTQFISASVHLDKNGNKYATYPSLVNTKQTVSDWISDIHFYPKRSERISNNDEWIDNNPEFTSRAIWPITFEFTNDMIHNKISYQLYSNTAAVTGREYIASFKSNTNIDVYLMTGEPEEYLFISDISVKLCYDSTTIEPTKYSLSTNSSVNPMHSTIFPSNTITSNIITVQYIGNSDTTLFDELYFITICCSIISFSIGIVITMLVCNLRRKQIKSKQEHKHEAIPNVPSATDHDDDNIDAVSFELSKTETNEKEESVKERMQLINHNSDAHSEYDSDPIALDTAHLVPSCRNTQSVAIEMAEDGEEEDEFEDDEDEYEDMYTNETNTVTAAHCISITPRTMDLDINSFEMNPHPGSGSRQSSSLNAVVATQKEDQLQIRQWLEKQVELPQYLENFQRFGYQSMKFIREISNKTELSEIGIVIKGHQTKIMAEIHKLPLNHSQIEGRNNNDSCL